jgi:hypothetical protein
MSPGELGYRHRTSTLVIRSSGFAAGSHQNLSPHGMRKLPSGSFGSTLCSSMALMTVPLATARRSSLPCGRTFLMVSSVTGPLGMVARMLPAFTNAMYSPDA